MASDAFCLARAVRNKQKYLMGTEEPKDMLKNVDWRTLGNAVTNKTSTAVPKKRFSESRFKQIPDYYFLPKRSLPYVVSLYGTIIAAGIGAGMLLEKWINKKIQEDGGVVWEFD